MSSSFPADLGVLSAFAPELATTIARVASDVALVIDRGGVILNVGEGPSPLAASCSEWVGRHWADTATADTRRKIEMLLEEVRTSGVTRRREVNHHGPGGADIPLTWAAIRLGDEGQVLAVGRDLRAVAAIQQRLVDAQQDMERQYWSRRQAENRYRLLFQVASDGVLVLAAASLQVLEANAAATGLFGLQGGALIGRPLPEGLPIKARAAVAELLANARSTGRAGEIRVRAWNGGGALDISATPFRDDDQQQLLVRARLDESDAAGHRAVPTMAAFVETTPDAVIITDSAGRILMANPAFVRLSGHDNESQVRGRPVQDLLGDDDGSGGWVRLISRALVAGIVPRTLLHVKAPRALPLAVEATAALLTEGEQACVGLTLRTRARAEPWAAPLQPANDMLYNGVALHEQLGRVPLCELLAEINQRAERHLVASALKRSGGLRPLAAELLGLAPEALDQLMQRHTQSVDVLDAIPDGQPPLRH